MKKIKIFTLILILSSRVHALSPYSALYDLYADTNMGNFKIGIAEFSLETDDENYIYTSQASTISMCNALYKFSMYEQSICIISYN